MLEVIFKLAIFLEEHHLTNLQCTEGLPVYLKPRNKLKKAALHVIAGQMTDAQIKVRFFKT